MKYLKYIVLSTLVVSIFSCEKIETPVFTDKPSFEFADTVASAPMGFIAEGTYNQKLVIKIFGRLPQSDIKLKLNATGTAQSGRDYKLPDNITFPKGASEITVDCEIYNSPELSKLGNRDLFLTIESSVASVTGIRPKARIKIEVDLPSQWVGNEDDNFAFSPIGKCTKAKYQFLYKTLGFYDFSTLPEYSEQMKLYTKMQTFANYLNQKIKEENTILVAAGKDTLKDDDGSELEFK